MTSTIKIIFDNQSAVYFPGQTVVGRVQLATHETVSINGVTIKFTGQARTRWETGTGDSNQHFGKEEYYNKKIYLCGNGHEIVSLSKGHHEYAFNFTLPQNIPSSYESRIGLVRHQCKAEVIIPRGKAITDKQPFSVNNLYDLNKDNKAMEPVDRKEKKSFTFSSGCIFLTLKIDRTGFVPGEKLPVHCEVDIECDQTIENITMKLVKEVYYHDYTTGGSKIKEKMTLGVLGEKDIAGRGKHVLWSNARVFIPAVPASYLQHCNLIDITYKLKLSMSPSGFHRDLDIEQPIIIGSIPLQQHFGHYQKNSSNDASLKALLNTATNSIAVHRVNMPPPSIHISEVPQATECNNEAVSPVFPGLKHYPEMPHPSYSASQHSVPMEDTQYSSGVPQAPFIPSYVTFKLHNSRPGTPH